MGDQPVINGTRSTDLPPDAPWWARWLVANWNEAYKWASVWWPGLCAAAIEVWAQLPVDQQQKVIDWAVDLIPAPLRPHALAGVFMASIFFRIVSLAKVKEVSVVPREAPDEGNKGSPGDQK